MSGRDWRGLALGWIVSCFVLVAATQAGQEGRTGELPRQQTFTAAQTAYAAGQWGEAVRLYEALLKETGFSASLCYNLANALVQNGQTGLAIVRYEQALLLSSGLGGDIRHNLHQVRAAHHLSEPGSWWQAAQAQLAGLLNLNQWAVALALLLSSLAALYLAALRFPPTPRIFSLLIRATGGAALLFVLGGMGIATQYQRWQQAVVISPSAPLLISPFVGAQRAQDSQEGRLIRILQRHDNFALIEDETGQRGWLVDSSFMTIAPPSSP